MLYTYEQQWNWGPKLGNSLSLISRVQCLPYLLTTARPCQSLSGGLETLTLELATPTLRHSTCVRSALSFAYIKELTSKIIIGCEIQIDTGVSP